MGQIKNIKLHIVTDIKPRLSNNSHSKRWPTFQFQNLLVCTVPSSCTTMTSISPGRRWPGLFAKALQGRNIGDLICNVGSAPAAGGGAPAAAAGGDAAAAAPAEEKKEEKKEESESGSDDDMGFGLFD